MLQIHDIRETRVYQDALKEGMEKGIEKGIERGMEKGVEKGMATSADCEDGRRQDAGGGDRSNSGTGRGAGSEGDGGRGTKMIVTAGDLAATSLLLLLCNAK